MHVQAMRDACSGVDGNVARTNEALSLLERYAAAFRRLYDVAGWQEECQRVAGTVTPLCQSCVLRVANIVALCSTSA
jgi:hypothetical protein